MKSIVFCSTADFCSCETHRELSISRKKNFFENFHMLLYSKTLSKIIIDISQSQLCVGGIFLWLTFLLSLLCLETISRRRLMRSLILERYFFSIWLCTFLFSGFCGGEPGGLSSVRGRGREKFVTNSQPMYNSYPQEPGNCTTYH